MSAASIPDLFLDEPPIGDDDLDRFFGAAVEESEQTHVDIGAVVIDLMPALAGRDHDEARGWRIEDLGAAEWAMRRYGAAAAELGEIEERWRDARLRLDEWLARSRRPLDARLAWFGHHLEDYQRRRRELDQRAKTLRLPSGEVTSTGRGAQMEVADSELLTRFLLGEGLEQALRIEPAKSHLGEVMELRTVFDRTVEVELS